MRKVVSKLFLILFCFTISFTLEQQASGQAAQTQQRKRVAVLDFEYGTVQRWWEGSWDVGKGIADLMVDKMVNDGTFSVIERKRLDAVLAEQNFSNSDRADPATAARIGKLLGVNAIIVGSITQFGTEKRDIGVGGLIGRVPGLGGGTVGTQKGKAKVAITARLIDVNTGEILASSTGAGESKRSGLLLSGIGVGGGGIGAGSVSMTSSDFRQTILGEATHSAVDSTVKQLTASGNKIPTTKVEVSGLVADVSGKTVILNVGKSHGVQPGSTLKVMRVTRTVKDPATGKVLKEIAEEVGQVQITEADDSSSTGTIVSGAGIKVGDAVKSQ